MLAECKLQSISEALLGGTWMEGRHWAEHWDMTSSLQRRDNADLSRGFSYRCFTAKLDVSYASSHLSGPRTNEVNNNCRMQRKSKTVQHGSQSRKKMFNRFTFLKGESVKYNGLLSRRASRPSRIDLGCCCAKFIQGHLGDIKNSASRSVQ